MHVTKLVNNKVIQIATKNKHMRKETKAASKDVISKVLGGIIIAAGMAYLFFGSQHCDAARFLAMCVCLGAGLKIIEDD